MKSSTLTRPVPEVLQVLAYPAILGSAMGLFFLLKGLSWPVLLQINLPVVWGAFSITFLELRMPYQRNWNPEKKEIWNDSLFLVTMQMVLPRLLALLVSLTLLVLLGSTGFQARDLWPHGWSIGWQVVLMVVVADFLRYWLHRFSHEIPYLWRLHAVHHSSRKLYWLNVGRFHPLEKTLQFLFDALPFILVGVSVEVLGLYFVFYAVNGFFQHCNIDVRMGFLNYVISGPQLHRWHHSRIIAESNNNYGNNIIVWDLLFGTYFLPAGKHVKELGLLNPSYPDDYASMLRTPFSGAIDKYPLPLQTFRDILVNVLLKLRMHLIGVFQYRQLRQAAADPERAQKQVLLCILRDNFQTDFGKAHGFSEIGDTATYRSRVSVQDYEALRPQIERQDRENAPILTRAMPFMYNRTSGSTGSPKDIPVVKETLDALKKSQKVFSYLQYKVCPEAFSGKLLGMVSPANEGRLASGRPYGSASGHIYNSMPSLARSKYVLPGEVFEIEDYQVKYYVMARLAVEHKDVTYLGSANPSSFHKLLDVIRTRFAEITADISEGGCTHMEDLSPATAAAIRKKLRRNPTRASELQALRAEDQKLLFRHFWPYLKLLATWTGGSCGIPLKSILPAFPEGVKVIDIGYLSSEMRGTITIEAETNEGLPTLQENFFEFVEKSRWESGVAEFLGLEQIKQGEEYYLFVTTRAGLYRYNMNDIVRVAGKWENTPTLKFVQKGRGVTNITGEKLYEGQVIDAVRAAEKRFELDLPFFQMVADEESFRYDLYCEPASGDVFLAGELADFLDEALQNSNLEYRTKRQGGRLQPLFVHRLKSGAFEAYKTHFLAKGQREGQFKPQLLQYKKDIPGDFLESYSI